MNFLVTNKYYMNDLPRFGLVNSNEHHAAFGQFISKPFKYINLSNYDCKNSQMKNLK